MPKKLNVNQKRTWAIRNIESLKRHDLEDRRIMGVDVSLNGTGVAIMTSSGQLLHSETITHEEGDHYPQKLGRISNRFNSLIDEYGAEIICFEAITVSTNFTGLRAVSYVAGILFALADTRPEIKFVATVNISQIKKYATGSGRTKDKSLVMRGAKEKWGYEFEDDNQCDAYVAGRIFSDVATLARAWDEASLEVGDIFKYFKLNKKPEDFVHKAILEKEEWFRLNEPSIYGKTYRRIMGIEEEEDQN